MSSDDDTKRITLPPNGRSNIRVIDNEKINPRIVNGKPLCQVGCLCWVDIGPGKMICSRQDRRVLSGEVCTPFLLQQRDTQQAENIGLKKEICDMMSCGNPKVSKEYAEEVREWHGLYDTESKED